MRKLAVHLLLVLMALAPTAAGAATKQEELADAEANVTALTQYIARLNQAWASLQADINDPAVYVLDLGTRIVRVRDDRLDQLARTAVAVLGNNPELAGLLQTAFPEELTLLTDLGIDLEDLANPLLAPAARGTLTQILRQKLPEMERQQAAQLQQDYQDVLRGLQQLLQAETARRDRLAREVAALAAAPAAPACLDRIEGYGGAATVRCFCSAHEVEFVGPIWGAGVYTSDSDICGAARHAGAVTAAGGVVELQLRPEGCARFEGSIANGLESGAWDRPWNQRPAFFFPAVGGACPAAPEPAEWCDTTAESYAAYGLDAVRCNCSPSLVEDYRAVYGTDVYSADSDVCGAARHAGLIDVNGGIVELRLNRDRCDWSAGSLRNGLQSLYWHTPAGAAGFYFPAAGTGVCGPRPAELCPELNPFEQPTADLTCHCPSPRLTAQREIEGTGLYTETSDICLAALHAGAVTPAGGDVTARFSGPCRHYAGSTRNGVTSDTYDQGDWAYRAGQYSFAFPGHGDGAPCPQ